MTFAMSPGHTNAWALATGTMHDLVQDCERVVDELGGTEVPLRTSRPR